MTQCFVDRCQESNRGRVCKDFCLAFLVTSNFGKGELSPLTLLRKGTKSANVPVQVSVSLISINAPYRYYLKKSLKTR